ncbi:hypothetical protein J0X14_03540 [Muricauda sp. CAU 1633]|uniref:hypothetical protein n=1 Tax=Allomuricauda sp. CAU 1633 TaxID=2816036 RepID=UPI001A900259|nr:hypothetical protein [Muricauda sp. CAU 1633]MBO0321358.1 hypothetical protein [Muricauda sp. CAU 1633]
MKKLVFLIMGFGLGVISLQAQSDLPTTRPLKIGDNNNLDVKASNQGTSLRMPSVLDESLTSDNEKPGVQMLPDRELLQAGHDLVIDPKVGEKEKKGSNEHFGDQYLGDLKTSAKFVGVVCRDHEYVDGDRIKIYLNGEVVEYNLLLSGSFRGVNLDLAPGFNRIEFEALNQGSSGPNTAQVVVADDKGEVIHNNRWNLSTGSKASLIIVKEEE